MRDAKGNPTGVLIDQAQGLVSQKIPSHFDRAARGSDSSGRRRNATARLDDGARRGRRSRGRRGLQASDRQRRAEDAALRDAQRLARSAASRVREGADQGLREAPPHGAGDQDRRRRRARIARRRAARTVQRRAQERRLADDAAGGGPRQDAGGVEGRLSNLHPRDRRPRESRGARYLRKGVQRSAGRAKSAAPDRARADSRCRRHSALRAA